jgi:hypothetical protein
MERLGVEVGTSQMRPMIPPEPPMSSFETKISPIIAQRLLTGDWMSRVIQWDLRQLVVSKIEYSSSQQVVRSNLLTMLD